MCLPDPKIICLTNLTTSALLAHTPVFKKAELVKRMTYLDRLGTITSQGPTKLCGHPKPNKYSGKIKQQKEMN